MKRADRTGNEFYDFGQEMEQLVKKAIKEYQGQHIGYMKNKDIANKLQLDASIISRKMRDKEDGGHSIYVSDLFEWSALIGVSPVEILAHAMLEYGVQERLKEEREKK